MNNFESASANESDEVCVLNQAARRIRKHRRKNLDQHNPFCIGQLIEDKEQINQIVKAYALEARIDIYIGRNKPLRYRVVCKGENPQLVGVEVVEGEIGQNNGSICKT